MSSARSMRQKIANLVSALRTDADVRRAVRSSAIYPPEVEREVLATHARLRRHRQFAFTRPSERVERIVGASLAFAEYWSLEYLFREIFVDACYAFRAVTPSPRIVDCGSNIGMSVLFFKTLYPAAEILAFEPGVAAHALLAENVRRNGWRDVRVLPCAVAEEPGTVEFFSDPAHPGSLHMSTRAERLPAERVSHLVEAVRLSSHLDAPVDLLKLDVEGAELGVLRDLRRSGAVTRVREMIVEYHHHVTRDDDRLSELLGILEGCGFGYQLRAHWPSPRRPGAFQDVLVHAYRRGSPADGDGARAATPRAGAG